MRHAPRRRFFATVRHDALSPPTARLFRSGGDVHARSHGRPAATPVAHADAARFLGISIRTLEKHRTYGTGPVYRKIGGRVVYAVADLQAWTAIGARKSTTDQDRQPRLPGPPPDPGRAWGTLNDARRA